MYDKSASCFTRLTYRLTTAAQYLHQSPQFLNATIHREQTLRHAPQLGPDTTSCSTARTRHYVMLHSSGQTLSHAPQLGPDTKSRSTPRTRHYIMLHNSDQTLHHAPHLGPDTTSFSAVRTRHYVMLHSSRCVTSPHCFVMSYLCLIQHHATQA